MQAASFRRCLCGRGFTVLQLKDAPLSSIHSIGKTTLVFQYNQGIEDIHERKLGQIFLYTGNGKYFEELFTLILNGIVIGRYVSFASIVRHAKLPDWSRCMQRNEAVRYEKTETSDDFFRSET